MIHLYVFGPLDLRSEDGRALDEVPSQPKRAALLAYLAAATPRGYHRRDVLLGVFWPELDPQRARQALNTAVSYLRGILGKAAVVRRGAAELALSPEHFWCDVWAFDDAIRGGRLAEALDLYRGDLLEGFFLSDSTEFEHWLDRERARRRDQASEAAWTLAERAEAEGDAAQASRWARRAMALTPHDEAALRRLISLLDRIGDRAGALREFEEFARRLHDELDAEPSARTRALVDEIRMCAVEPEPSAVAPVHPAEAGPPTGAAEAPWERSRPAPVRAPDAPAASHGASGNPSHAQSRSVTRVSGDRRSRSARTRRIHGGAVLVASFIALLAFAAAGSLVLRVHADSAPEPPHQDADASPWFDTSQLTTSFDAFTHYRTGLEAFKGGDFPGAVQHLQEAVAIDTSFTLAYLYLAMAANWTGNDALVRWAIDRAAGGADRLEPPKAAAIHAWRAYFSGDPARAERQARDILTRYVDPDAYHVLAEILYHWKPTLGESALRSRAMWERTLALRATDEGDIGALIHLARIAAAEGDTEALRRLTGRILDHGLPADDPIALEARALAAFVLGGDDDRRDIMAELGGATPSTIAEIAKSVAVFVQDLEAAAALVEFLTGSSGDRATVAGHTVMQAQIDAARGDIRAATARLRTGALPADRAAELHAAFALAPPAAVADEEIASLRDPIERSPTNAFVGPGMDFLASDGIYPPRRLYLLGQLSLRLGDVAAADRYAVALERGAGRTGMDTRYFSDYGRLLRAEIARACGRPARALEALGEPGIPAAATLPHLLDHPKAHERWLRAELLRDLGRHDEALAWYATFPDPQGYDLLYLAAAHLRQAQIFEARGDSRAAELHRERLRSIRDRDGAVVEPAGAGAWRRHPACSSATP